MMRFSPFIAAFLAALVAEVCVGAEMNDLDRGAEAMAAGRYEDAVRLYREANSREPRAEGLNNLGLALEHVGGFGEAVDAYKESLQLPNASDRTRTNLWRARVRAALQTYWPHAAAVCLGLLGLLLAMWLVRQLARAWAWIRERTKYRGVRLVTITHRVQCCDGQYQPDGKVYHDSETIAISADLALPARTDIYPLKVGLALVRPDGRTWRTFQETVETVSANRVNLWFQVGEIAEVLAMPGSWQARIAIPNVGREIGRAAIAVVSRPQLIADLEVKNAGVVALCRGEAGPGEVVFPDVESIVPHATIRPRSCHPTKFAGMQARLELARTDCGDALESQTFPIEMDSGEMALCRFSRPIAGNPIAEQTGNWEFRFVVEERVLVRLPFVIVSFEQARESIKAERVVIAGTWRSGQVAAVGPVVYTQNLRALCPVITLATRFPCPRLSYRMSLAASVDGEPVGGVEGPLVFAKKSFEIVPGEFIVPHLSEERETAEVSFVLQVEGRTLVVAGVTIRRVPPRCADAQGRIAPTSATSERDYAGEAASILGGARIRV